MNLIQSIGRILRPAPKYPVQIVDVFDWVAYPLWFRVEGIWYHPTVFMIGQWEKADTVIAKYPDDVFKYTKYRGGELRALNDEELKDMAWVILSAEKA